MAYATSRYCGVLLNRKLVSVQCPSLPLPILIFRSVTSKSLCFSNRNYNSHGRNQYEQKTSNYHNFTAVSVGVGLVMVAFSDWRKYNII